MSTGTIPFEFVTISKPGTYIFPKVVAPCYTSGSGNYFDFVLPVRLASNLYVSAISIEQGSLYVGTERIDGSKFASPLLADFSRLVNALRLDCKFSTTQSYNRGGCLACEKITLTVI